MGIRVRKCIGYGLTDIECDEHRLVDERLDPEGYLFHAYDVEEEGEDKYPWERDGAKGYWNWLQKNFTKDELYRGPYLDTVTFSQLKGEKKKEAVDRWSPYRSAIHEGEFGLSNVLLVVPFCQWKGWSRYDDSIDWAEETQAYGQENRVVVYEQGFYPWNTFSVDPKTGVPYVGFHYTEVDELRKEGRAVPKVPDEVTALCKYLKIFRDDKTIIDLRPMMYVYWS